MLRTIFSNYGKIIDEPLLMVETHMMLLGKPLSTVSILNRSRNITLLDMAVFMLFQIRYYKRENGRCTCGSRSDVKRYIFGRCPVMKHFFKFNKDHTLRQNPFRILFSQENYNKVKENNNILNETFSFIKYKF